MRVLVFTHGSYVVKSSVEFVSPYNRYDGGAERKMLSGYKWRCGLKVRFIYATTWVLESISRTGIVRLLPY